MGNWGRGLIRSLVVGSGRNLVLTSSDLLDKSSVLGEKGLELVGSLLGVWVWDVVGDVALGASELAGVDKTGESLDVLLEDVLSALELVKGALGKGVLLDEVVVNSDGTGVNSGSGVGGLEGSVSLGKLHALSLHLLDSLGELLVVNLESSALMDSGVLVWGELDGVDLNLLLEVVHMLSWLLDDSLDWDVDGLDDLNINKLLLDDLDLSLDDNIKWDWDSDLILDVLWYFGLGDNLDLDDLLDGNWGLDNHLDWDLDNNDVVGVLSSGLWDDNGDWLFLWDWSLLDNVVLDVLDLESGWDLNWGSDHDVSVVGSSLPEWDGGVEWNSEVSEVVLNGESVDWDDVRDGVLYLVAGEDCGLVLDGGGVWDLLDDSLGLLDGLDLGAVLVLGELVMDLVFLVDWVVDHDLVDVVAIFVAVLGELVLDDSLGWHDDRLDLLVELVDWDVYNVSDHVDLVVWDLDNLLLGVKSDVSIKYVVDSVVSSVVGKLGDVDFDDVLVTGLFDGEDGSLVLDDLEDWDVHNSLDIDELLLNLGSWDLDDLLDVILDDFLDWDLLDSFDNKILLDDLLNVLGGSNVIWDIDISDDWDLLLDNDVDEDLLDLLNNNGFLLVSGEIGSLDNVRLRGDTVVSDGLTLFVSGSDNFSLNVSLLYDSSWSHGGSDNVGVGSCWWWDVGSSMGSSGRSVGVNIDMVATIT